MKKGSFKSLICVLLSAISVSSCVHFSSNSFKEEFSSSELNFTEVDGAVYIKTNNYSNWSSVYSLNRQVANAIVKSFDENGISVKIIGEKHQIPNDYYEITTIVDNTVDDEYRSFSPLSILSGIWMGLSVFVLPAVSSDFTVLIKVNHFSGGEVVSSHLYSSHMYYLVGLSMLPFSSSDDVGDSLASIVSNITSKHIGQNNDAL